MQKKLDINVLLLIYYVYGSKKQMHNNEAKYSIEQYNWTHLSPCALWTTKVAQNPMVNIMPL